MSSSEIKLIVGLVIAGLVILGAVIYCVVMGIKNKWFSKLYEALKVAIKEAEESGKSGDEKKKYVMEQMVKKCEELGIPYDQIKNLISKAIDKIIENYNTLAKK